MNPRKIIGTENPKPMTKREVAEAFKAARKYKLKGATAWRKRK